MWTVIDVDRDEDSQRCEQSEMWAVRNVNSQRCGQSEIGQIKKCDQSQMWTIRDVDNQRCVQLEIWVVRDVDSQRCGQLQMWVEMWAVRRVDTDVSKIQMWAVTDVNRDVNSQICEQLIIIMQAYLYCAAYTRMTMNESSPPYELRPLHLTMMGRECSWLDPRYQRHITFACIGCY